MRPILSGLAAIALTATLSSCEFFKPQIPQTQAEILSNSTYVPLDPLRVTSDRDFDCKRFRNPVVLPTLEALPDNAVRIAIGSYNNKGDLSFGPAQIGFAGKNYQVILDYINADTQSVRLIMYHDGPGNTRTPIFKEAPAGSRIVVQRLNESNFGDPTLQPFTVTLPVYVGVGMRLTANVSVLSGSVNLSSLSALAAAAEADTLSGSLIVQTLGISGKQVAANLPLPSEIDQTTIQNAILALGSIKAVLYDQEGTQTKARVIGIYNPISGGGPELVNAIVSALARSPIRWFRGCKEG